MPPTAIVDGLFELDPVRLIISKCGTCGALAFPPRQMCAACSSRDLSREQAPPQGTVYSWTVIRELGGARPDFQPYVVAQVDLAPGLRVQGMVDVPPGRLSIGDRVELGLSPIRNGIETEEAVTYCFVPVEEAL